VLQEPVRIELLRRAARTMGIGQLAVRLRVTEDVIRGWMAGYLEIPDRKFLLLIDVLDTED
jgi:hypothetical protein